MTLKQYVDRYDIERTSLHDYWTASVPPSKAGRVASAMQDAGYEVTADEVKDRYLVNIVNQFEPRGGVDAEYLTGIIVRACGW